MKITLTDMDSNFASQTQTWTTTIDYYVIMDVDFPLSGFTGVDISSIESVEFLYEGDYGGRDYIYSIQTIAPIPGSVLLLGSGLIGLVCIRKKFRNI